MSQRIKWTDLPRMHDKPVHEEIQVSWNENFETDRL